MYFVIICQNIIYEGNKIYLLTFHDKTGDSANTNNNTSFRNRIVIGRWDGERRLLHGFNCSISKCNHAFMYKLHI